MAEQLQKGTINSKSTSIPVESDYPVYSNYVKIYIVYQTNIYDNIYLIDEYNDNDALQL